MTSRYERMKMQRRMQRRIRLVVEERRIAFGADPRATESAADVEETVEIPPRAGPAAAPAAVGRVAVRSA